MELLGGGGTLARRPSKSLSGNTFQDGANDMQAQAFLDRHSPRLIEIANAADPELTRNSEISEFVDRIHADFETVTDKPGKRPSLPGEDVFWWCITILEELGELPRSGPTGDPYVLMMLDQLRAMGPRLASAEPLPPEFQIHWFDDDQATSDDRD